MAQTYQLHIEVEENILITIGRLGEFFFPSGRYVYTGSARMHLNARLLRHLSQAKTLRWHIDYLLDHRSTQIVSITTSRDEECRLNQRTGGEIVSMGFGSSDCRSGCGSHLKRI